MDFEKQKIKNDKQKKEKELLSKWTIEQEKLLAEWAEKAKCFRWLHNRSEKSYRAKNYAFTIPVIILSTLTGTANFAMDSFVPAENKPVAMAVVGSVNIFAGNGLSPASVLTSGRSDKDSCALGRTLVLTSELSISAAERIL